MSQSLVKHEGIFGATLLVAGCCIGGGMLGLPVVSAASGFLPSTLVLFLCCFFMISTGLLILEAALWFKEEISLITISKETLGKLGEKLTWGLFLFIFYCLMIAYISGSGQLISDFLSAFTHLKIASYIGNILSVFFIGALLFLGTRRVNPLMQCGESYLKEAKEAGFDSILVVDIPPEESFYYVHAMDKADLCPIFIVSPSTDEKRLNLISEKAKGFLYYACQKGTTGVRSSLPQDFSYHMKRIKAHSSLPVIAGFGISNRESAKEALLTADGFVVGSAFVRLIEERCPPQKLKECAEAIDPR